MLVSHSPSKTGVNALKLDPTCSLLVRWNQTLQSDLAQPLKVCGDIHVPKRDWLLPGESEVAQAPPRLVHDIRRAPAHIGEQCRLRLTHSDQHIAPVLRRDNHHIGASPQSV